VLSGDLGRSVRGGVGYDSQSLNPSVVHLIALRLPATAALATAALILVLLFGVPFGVYSARWRGSLFDRGSRLFASVGQAAPNFWIGLLLILVFAVYTHLLPAGGLTAGGIILPAITLSIRPIANLIRLLRSSMIESLSSDYVTFLRMKGLSENRILWKHALRNAGLTTLTFVGILISSLFTGSLLVETVFDWPGVGRLMIEAIDYRDFPLAQGVILMLGTIYIVMNLVVDLLYTVLNPRLRAN
jgi:peptide/nickel transport system permease protein